MTIPRLRCLSLVAATLALASLVQAAVGQASEDVLARSHAAYAALKSYADTGTVVQEYGTSSVSRHTFRTYYRAPRQFYFEFTEGQADGGSRTVIWCEGADFQSWGSETGVHSVYPRGQGASAFVSASYPTSGSATQIASMLFASAGLISTLTELADMTADGTEVINGRTAHKLTGIARSMYRTGYTTNVRRTTVWIDAETLLVRRVFEDTPKGTPAGRRQRVTTTFEPHANPTLDDSRFKFAVPLPK